MTALNAYWCHLPGRTVGMSWDPPDPGEYTVPCGIYIAATRGQAKIMFLDDHDRAVDSDEFVDVRTNLLERDVQDAPPGPLGESDEDWDGEGSPPDVHCRLWLLVPWESATEVAA